MKILNEKPFANEVLDFLPQIIEEKPNVLVIGNCGVGKTTLLKALIEQISTENKIMVVEEVSEDMKISKEEFKNVTFGNLEFESTENELKQLLRAKPDIIFIDEKMRGQASIKRILNLMAKKESQIITTIVAPAVDSAINRLIISIKTEEENMEDVIEQISKAIDVIVNIKKDINGQRYIEGIYKLEIINTNDGNKELEIQKLQ